MDVINFSGGGPQIDPANDALIEAVHDTVAAGVVTVIAAGNDRDDFGLGSDGSPGTAPDAISVAATSNTHVFAPVARRDRGRRARLAHRHPVHRRGRLESARRRGARSTSSSSTSARSSARTASRSSGTCAGRPARSTARRERCPPARSTARSRSYSAASARSPRKRSRRRLAGAIGIVLSDNRQGEANGLPDQLRRPGRLDREPRRRPAARLHGVARRPHDRARSGAARSSSKRGAAA